jgi:Actinobacteria/chloroflexi VLRF1 release factor
MPRFVGRDNVRKRLEPLEGSPGRTIYAEGAARIASEAETIVVRPPFGLAHEGEYETIRLAPLLEALAEDHLVAALLVRLGGYAVGVFDGERLVASKVGSRFVKGRHKKGGSSANRFRRRREEQARAAIEEAAAVAARVLDPWRDRAEHVALGGDRAAIREVLAASPQLAWLAERALPRFFAVQEPRRAELERLPYSLYSAEVTSEAGQGRPPGFVSPTNTPRLGGDRRRLPES